MSKRYVNLINSAEAFLERPIPPRTWLLDKTIPHPSLGMLYAYRGNGKTFTALDLAIHVARGESWMGYSIPQARPVLYVDGEMPLGDLHERLRQLTQGKAPDKLFIIASEDLAVEHESINLGQQKDRQAFGEAVDHIIDHRLGGENFGLIILDNWTSLIQGLDENDNTKLDPLKKWLMLLRHGEQSVLLVHHEGKARGGQRGATAREDMLDYSIRLSEISPHAKPKRFLVEWDKCRSVDPEPPEFIEVLEEVDGWLQMTLELPELSPAEEKRERILACLPARFVDIETATGLHSETVNRTLKEYAKKDGRTKEAVWKRK